MLLARISVTSVAMLGTRDRHKDRQRDHCRQRRIQCAGPDHQIFLTLLAPNSPSGRTSKTMTMIRYGTSTSNSG